MSYRTWSFLLSCASAIVFASIFIVPSANPADSPKAWAHGVGYVLPRIFVSDLLAFVVVVLFGAELYYSGRRAASHPLWLLTAVLLLPALYAFVFVIRVYLHSI